MHVWYHIFRPNKRKSKGQLRGDAKNIKNSTRARIMCVFVYVCVSEREKDRERAVECGKTKYGNT